MPSYNRLKAWRHAQQLAIECSRAAAEFPPHEEAGLAARLRQAAYRVPLEIAQGSARRASTDGRRFLESAQGSLAEVSAILELARDLGYVEMVRFARLEALADEAGKTLYGFARKLTGGRRKSQ